MADPGRVRTILALGTAQTLAWASSYYLPATLAAPIARDLQIRAPTVFAAFSAALVVSAVCGPPAGHAIDRFGGRWVLAATNVVFALGLALLSIVHTPLGLFAAWAILGVAMGSGLYEAAFASLVRVYGTAAGSTITGITLIAGFASTVGWPLSAVLEAHLGWRGACVTWALLHLFVGIPLNVSLPRGEMPDASGASVDRRTDKPRAVPEQPTELRAAVLLAFVFAAVWFVSTAMAAHLPRLLQAGGASVTAALAASALVGPSQVAGRLAEYGFLRRVHPLLSARCAALLHPLGAAVLMLGGAPLSAAFTILHGGGNGILTIAKGTLPLVLFGPHGYGHRQGLLMVPARGAQALAPWLFGICVDRWGAGSLWVSGGVELAAFGALMLVSLSTPWAARTP